MGINMSAFVRFLICMVSVLALSPIANGQFFFPADVAPEIDPASASGAVAIISGGLYLLRARFGRAKTVS